MHGSQNQAATSQFQWGSEASRTCIQFGEIRGAEEAEGPHVQLPKTKQMQDIKCVCACLCVYVCVCVCVCGMYTWAKRGDSVETWGAA